jgi:hypothetical protein
MFILISNQLRRYCFRLGSAANVFHSSSYLFIFETQNLTEAKFEMYLTEIALVQTLNKSGIISKSRFSLFIFLMNSLAATLSSST